MKTEGKKIDRMRFIMYIVYTPHREIHSVRKNEHFKRSILQNKEKNRKLKSVK
jgi:hypothetical protein